MNLLNTECFPLRPEQRDLDRGQRWTTIVRSSRETAEVVPDNMERTRQSTLYNWNKALINIRPIPSATNRKMLKGLQTCFSSRDNPYGQSGPNEHFQREHDELMEEDRDYLLPFPYRVQAVQHCGATHLQVGGAQSTVHIPPKIIRIR